MALRLLGIIGQEARRLDQPANKSSDTLTATPIVRGMMIPIDQDDYSVVVKLRALPPTPWKWEIYRAGKNNHVEQAPVHFSTMVAASRAGREALKQLLDKLPSQQLRLPAE
jgi:hypothetical protein